MNVNCLPPLRTPLTADVVGFDIISPVSLSIPQSVRKASDGTAEFGEHSNQIPGPSEVKHLSRTSPDHSSPAMSNLLMPARRPFQWGNQSVFFLIVST